MKASEELDKFADKIRSELIENQNDEKTFVESLRKKYGDGQLDPATGNFTPDK